MIYPTDICEKISDILRTALQKEGRITALVPDTEQGQPIVSIPTDKRAVILVYSPRVEGVAQQGSIIIDDVVIVIEVYYMVGLLTSAQANQQSEQLAQYIVAYLANSNEYDEFLYSNAMNYIRIYETITKVIPENPAIAIVPQIEHRIRRQYTINDIVAIDNITKILGDGIEEESEVIE